jgi:hypothetical protein
MATVFVRLLFLPTEVALERGFGLVDGCGLYR